MAGGDSNSTESLLNSPWTKLLGSATVVAAIIYVSGAAVMALRIWNSGLSWQPVVGQLPHDTLLSVGFAQVLAPAVLGSIIAGWLVTRKPGRWLYDEASKRINHGGAEGDPPARRGIRAWTTRAAFWLLASAVVTAILLIPTFAIWRVTSGRVDPGARRPIDELVALAAVAILVAIQPFFLYREWRWAGSGVMRVATATGLLLIPAVVASTSAAGSALLPAVVLCGNSFSVLGGPSSVGEIRGNLLGTSSDWAYVAQWSVVNRQASSAHVIAVPLSSVSLIRVGANSSSPCADLEPPKLTGTELPQVSSSSVVESMVAGSFGSFRIKAEGDPTPTYFLAEGQGSDNHSISGVPVTGLQFDRTTGVVSGVPAQPTPNPVSFLVVAENPYGQTPVRVELDVTSP
jgi:hypothetical protein